MVEGTVTHTGGTMQQTQQVANSTNTSFLYLGFGIDASGERSCLAIVLMDYGIFDCDKLLFEVF